MNTLLATILLSSSALYSTACQSTQPITSAQTDNQTTPHLLDGTFSDWETPNTADADAHYIYLHFSPKSDTPTTIQAAPYTTRIRIDVDQNPHTGRPMESLRLDASIQQPQGVDLLMELSPKNEKGEIGIGSQVTRYTAKGSGYSIGHAALGFMFLPTYSATQYEIRIDRLAPGAHMLRKTGQIDIVIDQVDEHNRYLWSTTLTLNLPGLEQSTHADTTIPTKPKNSVRVMSANVLYSSPLSDPEPFTRVLDAINPDVILYQEWFKTDPDTVEAWLKANAGPEWSLHMPSSRAGVALATRHRIIKAYDSVIPPSGNERPARAVAALIDTDAGELLAISIHLKCCGSAGSKEDTKRIEQARAINGFVRSVHQRHPNAKVVIAGDFNLVGSYAPMDTMVDSLGINGEDLSTINAQQLANNSMITWNDEKSRFSPGRLDWMLIDESMSKATNAFILDTRSLSPKSLESMGLQPDDSKASDHLPIVIDLSNAQ